MPGTRATTMLALALAAAPCAARAQRPDTGVTVTLWGYVQVRETYRRDEGLTATVHRARVLIEGVVRPAFSYRVSAELRSGGTPTARAGVALADAYARWSRAGWFAVAGQFKTPFGREFLIPSYSLELADRALVSDSIPPRRDIGVMIGRGIGSVATLSVGVFNGDGVNTVVNRDTTVLVVGRATIQPVRGLLLGVNAATYAGDSTRYGWDVGWEREGMAVRGEYLGQHRAAGVGPGPDDRGWHLFAARRVRGGLWLSARIEDFQRYSLGPASRTTAWTGGVLARLGGAGAGGAHERVLLFVDYTSRKTGAPAVRAGTAVAQLQLRF